MTLSRFHRVTAALVAIFSLLFMQLAVASYACPGMTTAMGQMDTAEMSAQAANQAMVGCQGMDMQQPGLCQAFDLAGSHSLDKPGVPQVPQFLAGGSFVPVASVTTVSAPSAAALESLVLSRATSPPIAILNCCFRI